MMIVWNADRLKVDTTMENSVAQIIEDIKNIRDDGLENEKEG